MNGSSLLLALDAAATVAFVALAVRAGRSRRRPGAVVGGLLWFALAAMSGAVALGRADLLAGRTAVSVVIVGWIVAVPLWAGFAFAHVGQGPQLNRRWAAIAAGYVSVAAGATMWGGWLGGPIGQLVLVLTSILQTVLIGLGLFGVFLVVRAAVTYDDLPVPRAAALSVGGLGVSLSLFSVSVIDAVDPETLPPLLSGFFAVIGTGFAIGVFRFRLFGDAPGAGVLVRRSVLEEMSEAVVVVDRDQRLVDANEAAERTFDLSLARDAGRPAGSALGDGPGGLEAGSVTLPTADGRRQFDVSRSVLTNARGDTVGTSYLFRDVTDERTREQRLEVFNRVLRHNLRNDLDAIRGFAEALSDGAIEDPPDVTGRIRTTASDLADIGETVERADRIMTRDALDTRPVDLEALAEAVATDVRERRDCRISVTAASERPTVHTDEGVLRTALLEVVENAVEHSDRDVPNVLLGVESTDGGARLTVRDDGPGIPDRERAVLLDGEETPLQHGTGVGLWFVSWAVTRLGGELSFGDTPSSGSEVVLHVPDRSGDRRY